MRRARRRRGTELNIVSMIDILTVLVFFLLVNQIGVSILGINLPDASAAVTSEPPPQDLSVVVRPDALTLANNGEALASFARRGAEYDYAGLRGRLRELKAAQPDDRRISLLVDAGIPYQIVVTLMDTVRADPGDGHGAEAELFPDIAIGAAPAPALEAAP
ncbi:MAG: biopolymer transporter ExbD [Solimonas sp.]